MLRRERRLAANVLPHNRDRAHVHIADLLECRDVKVEGVNVAAGAEIRDHGSDGVAIGAGDGDAGAVEGEEGDVSNGSRRAGGR